MTKAATFSRDHVARIDKKLATCCSCGGAEGVRNVMMMNRRAPQPGKGWGCVVCHLPADGAVAVLCDDCVNGEKIIKFVCAGYATEDGRVPWDALAPDHFDHDPNVSHEGQGHA